MAFLKVASNANAALTLPTILATAGDHLGSDKDAVELATDTGDRLIGDAIFTYLQDVAGSSKRAKQVDDWLECRAVLSVADFKALDKPMKELE
ncbi:hypothetical protein RU639_009770 [Aspergillus parasiticus]